MAAATAAANSAANVLLLDENPAVGGQVWRTGRATSRYRSVDGDRARSLAIGRLQASGVKLLLGYTIYDAPKAGELRAICETTNDASGNSVSPAPTLISLRYKKLILATGARERFLPFPGWTLPGVFGAGGLQAMVKGGFEIEGKRIVVAGSGPLLIAVAEHLRCYGGKVVCVAEQASISQMLPFIAGLWSHPGKVVQGIRYISALSSVPYRFACWTVAANANKGVLSSVRLTNGKRTWEEACDLLACGFHLVPNTELASLLGCVIEGGRVRVNENQQTSVSNIYCAGELTGIGGVDAARLQGEIAGLASVGKSTSYKQWRRVKEKKFAERLSSAFQLRAELRSLAKPDTLVCRCEDVSFTAIEGRSGWRDAKLQTRCGMGPCQGRICGAATEFLFGWKESSVRPPLTPVPIAALISRPFQSMDIKENS